MDWPRLAAGLAITIGVPFVFLVLPVILGTIVGRAIARGNGSQGA